MDRFRTRRFNTDEGWFHVGGIEVTTAILVSALCVLSMFVYAIDQSLLEYALLTNAAITSGEVWRFFTWWAVNPPDVWVALHILFFWWMGHELERALGKVRFLWLVGILILVPAVITAGIAVATGIDFSLPLALVSRSGGVDFLLATAIVSIALAFPSLRGFFNIPFWVLGAVIIGVDLLFYIGNRAWGAVIFVLLSGGVAAIMMRAFGLADQPWIPRVPLPQVITGDPYQKANRQRIKEQRKQQGTQSAKAGGKQGGSGRAGLRRTPKAPAEVVPIRPEARLDRAGQADMDALLDKISATGIDSLTPDERQRLDEHSRRLRGQ